MPSINSRAISPATTPVKQQGAGTTTVAAILLILTLASAFEPSVVLGTDRGWESFQNPPAEARTRMFWRVFGPAWSPAEIDYQLALLKQAGVGGVTAFFMYPVALDDPGKGIRNQKYLSPPFLNTFSHAAEEARKLGLRFSIAGGTGWPYGGPSVTPQDSAQRLREVTVACDATNRAFFRLPRLEEGESYVAAFFGSREVTVNPNLEAVTIPGSDGSTLMQLFVAGPTQMRVKRAALGAEGLVLDHLNQQAAQRYLESTVAPMLRAAPRRIDSIFCDSLEVYSANWTSDFLDTFRRRRGYDLRARLPDLFQENSPASANLRFDFWRTHAELTEERFTRVMADWMRRHNLRFEMEAYGTPPNPLTAAVYIDVPTGEQYEWKGFSLSRLAASGAHLARKKIIAAEAWTWTGLPNRLADSLSDLKLASDLHFLAGINDLVGVDFAYSPRSVGAPGWLPYYGPCVNQNNPQWPWFHCLVDYTSRCQWLLRTGQPVAEVAIYLPVEDKFASGPVDQMLLGFHLRDHFVTGEKTGEFGLTAALAHHSDLIHGLLTHGFNYDGIDFFSMERLVRVKAGKLAAGDGSYSILILPNLMGMELKALQKAAVFCRSGGTVIATKRLPDRCYGLNQAGDTEALRSLISAMFGKGSGRFSLRLYGKGTSMFVPEEGQALLDALGVLTPDVRLEPHQPEVGFVHRASRDRDAYFLANVGNSTRSFKASFRQSRKHVSIWDPMNGQVHSLNPSESQDRFTALPVKLAPRSSTFVVFDFALSKFDSTGLPGPSQTKELSPTWLLNFEGADAPPPRLLNELVSWTSWPEAKYYSGRATYTASFQWNDPLPAQARLILSQLHEVAAISLNGARAGEIWTPPYEIDVTRLLKAGSNTLSLTVANLPLNRFLGAPEEDLKSLRAAYGNRFPEPPEKRAATPPSPSGLIGPVALRFVP